jgi:hypothetical protein
MRYPYITTFTSDDKVCLNGKRIICKSEWGLSSLAREKTAQPFYQKIIMESGKQRRITGVQFRNMEK